MNEEEKENEALTNNRNYRNRNSEDIQVIRYQTENDVLRNDIIKTKKKTNNNCFNYIFYSCCFYGLHFRFEKA